MITVECSRTDCGAEFEAGMETDWTDLSFSYDPFEDCDYGPSIVVALPEGWAVDRVGAGDAVIHCPEHADA